jgi:hypothetical protein
MSAAGVPKWSYSLEQAESSRLAWAFGLSLAVHLLVFGTYIIGVRLHWWDELKRPAWTKPPVMLSHLFKQPPAAQQAPRTAEVPMVFVQVSPQQTSLESPSDARYYSDKNSQAANPDPPADTQTPRFTGTQEQIVRTEDVARERPVPLQPAPPLESVEFAPTPQDEVKAQEALTPGDLALARPEPEPQKRQGEAKKTRPKTVTEARLRNNIQRLPGEKMRQEGGVRRRLEIGSLDAKATPFGAYDAALIEAISQRWYALLDERSYASEMRGKVVVQFRLHYDGRVTDMNIAENTAGEMLALLCLSAVRDPAPYMPWTTEMRRVLGDRRNIQFTFYYN